MSINERTSHAWRAVSVEAGEAPCAPVRALLGKRFLVAQAPRLPLLECPWADDCDCQFRHHDDRRAERRAENRAASRQAERRALAAGPKS
jgi:hypothetical protein